MKKFLALLLALVMVLSLVACGEDTPDTTPSTNDNSGDTTPSTTEPVVEVNPTVDSYTQKYDVQHAGEITMNLAEGSAEGEDVNHTAYTGVEGKDYTDPEVYTYNDYLTGTTSGMVWDPLNWETSTDSYILDMTISSFWEFVLNDTLDGWAVVPGMADELAVDVTADYVGQYGIVEGESGKAWQISLNELACWEDGTPINADTYIYSYQQQLNPLMMNRRADSLYAGDAAIYNAKAYLYSGRISHNENATGAGYEVADLTLGEDGIYYTPAGLPVYVAVNYALSYWLNGYSLNAYVSAYGDTYFNMENWDALVALTDADGLALLTEESLGYLVSVISTEAWNEDETAAPYYLVYDEANPETNWEDVGIIKIDDYTLVLVTTQPIENASYYVPYNLGGTALVYEELYESCKTYFDAEGNKVEAGDPNVASITTNYGTSAETYMSYGPYKLSYFELDKKITFVRNDTWFGYHDGLHLGQYQTDIVDCVVVENSDTARLMFLNGEIDAVSLDADAMVTYGTSEYVRYTPQSYTTKLTFNTNFDALYSRGTGSQVLVNQNLRKAIALCMDRSYIISFYSPASSAGFGMLNNMYIYDPFTGATYRGTEAAMAALCDVYGVTYGEGGEYDTLEDAYDAITGYNLNEAKAAMALAYDECIAEGLYDGVSNISLELSLYASDDEYVQLVNYLNEAIAAVTAGTGFEGKLSVVMKVDSDYYNTMYSGGTDMITTTWGGAASNPYSMLAQCYCDAADGSGSQMEYGYDTTKVMVTININGVDYTASLHDWAFWCNSDADYTITAADGSTLSSFASYDAESRAAVYAKLEAVYLKSFVTTPMYYRCSASLISQKINYAVNDYIDLVGFGGIQFFTYNYTDAQWAEVAGTLTY